MTISDPYIEIVLQLADIAGDIARHYFGKPPLVEHKADQSPVTAADKEIEAALRAHLERACPSHGIFGEEHGRLRPQAEYQWVIDPIDGTKAFIAGQATFTTLIALVKNNRPVLGIIDQPIKRERWVGAYGQQTCLNKKPVEVSACRDLSQARIATTSSAYFTAQEAVLFAAISKQASQTTLGGDAYAYAKLASGEFDVVIDASLKPYDFCALPPVIEGAGGIITDWRGNAITQESQGQVVACSSRALHEALITLLRPAAI